MEYVDNPTYFQMIWAPIASVGWYIVGFMAIVWYIFPHVQEQYKSWKLIRNQQDNAAAHKKSDEFKMSPNVEFSRQKLQDAYKKSCNLAQIKEEEEKERKRQKVLKLLENKNVGEKLGKTMDNETPSTSSKSKSFKSDYNPLMGDNTRGYRPPKRSCCGKGGCG